MDGLEQSRLTGIFEIPSGEQIYGELTLAGSDTILCLKHNKSIDCSKTIPCLFGTLHNQKKVTLLDCITTSTHSGSSFLGTYYFANLFPHYVLVGDRQFARKEKTITQVDFVINDASTLFYDFEAFGAEINAYTLMEQIVEAKAESSQQKSSIGSNPSIFYFTGKHEICSVDTVLGKVFVSHRPNFTYSGPDGITVENTIIISIIFKEAYNFDETISSTQTLIDYFGMLIGCPQNLLKLNMHVKTEHKHPTILEVYWSMLPNHTQLNNELKPHYLDVLIKPIQQPDMFATVLSNWLEKHSDRHDARSRFFTCFREQTYTIDRLIRAANMFDILPNSAIPADVTLSEDLRAAKEQCRQIFKELPESPERDSVLSALGRVGKSSLKNKIRYRGEFLINRVEEKFPNLNKVIDLAVDCRNHYVHGSKPKIDYTKNFHIIIFLIDTLEFIFAISELIEAKWDIKEWIETFTTKSHPFNEYRITYMENLHNLESLIQ
jgi:hypothetical protein